MAPGFCDLLCLSGGCSAVCLGPRSTRNSRARWFTRGWCLQELIAPTHVKFYANDWSEIGTKLPLCDVIHTITLIPPAALLKMKSLDKFNVAERMSWAACRETTRPEDMVYCLLSIFDVNMSMLYGEGRHKAFYRLQEEILKQSDDLSLLLWTNPALSATQSTEQNFDIPVLAHGPQCFSWFTGLKFSFSQIKELLADKSQIMTIGPTVSCKFSGICHNASLLTSTLPEPLLAGKECYFPPQITSSGLRVCLTTFRLVAYMWIPRQEVP